MLDVKEIQPGIQENLRNDSIRSVGALVNLDQAVLDPIQNIKVGHIQALLLFKIWFSKFLTENVDIPGDWVSTFTEDAREEFLLKESIIPPPPTPLPAETTSVAPTSSSTSNMPQIKVDIRSYLEFNGKLKDWKVFKKQFISVALLHGISSIMEDVYIVSLVPSE